MGVALSTILEPEKIEITDLAHRIVAIDAYNMLYQFLTTIRMRDGTPLKNSKGRVTSHLVGLLSRTTTFLEHNIKLVFVYDGKKPALKKREVERRTAAKTTAQKKFLEAEQEEDVEGMKKYAGRTARLTKEMVEESQELLEALGIPWVQAPAEAEAQASHMVITGAADFVGSQDMDCLLFGAPHMLKNLSITGKRRRPGTNTYYNIQPEHYTLEKELRRLDINQEQLVMLGMIIGTDFNPGGIKGLGPKKGLKLVKEHTTPDTLFKEIAWDEHQDVSWEEVMDVITDMPVTDDYTLTWNKPDDARAHKFLVEEFEFSPERVNKALERIHSASAQKGLGDYF